MSPSKRTLRPSVLVVDDEDTLRDSLVRAADLQGYEAAGARDGLEAWERLGNCRFDVVVTDLKMPGLSGPELLERIDRDQIPTRVVVITAYASLDAAVDCLRRGAVDFLVKPFEVEAFLASLANALTRPLPSGDVDWPTVASQYGLSSRQTQVLRVLVQTGKTYGEIAEELCISPHTVKSHIQGAFQKMGITNRAQLPQKLRGRGE